MAFCVEIYLRFVCKREKEKLSNLCGVRAVYAYLLILEAVI